MIFGKFDILNNGIDTHNDSHILAGVTTISARRPFLGAGCLIAVLISGFGVAFIDLLRPAELLAIAVGASGCLFLGLWLGHLQLLSRDLRGSELGSAIWGSYRHLNYLRRQVAEAVNRAHGGIGQ